jgi:hypothetical protein
VFVRCSLATRRGFLQAVSIIIAMEAANTHQVPLKTCNHYCQTERVTCCSADATCLHIDVSRFTDRKPCERFSNHIQFQVMTPTRQHLQVTSRPAVYGGAPPPCSEFGFAGSDTDLSNSYFLEDKSTKYVRVTLY